MLENGSWNRSGDTVDAVLTLSLSISSWSKLYICAFCSELTAFEPKESPSHAVDFRVSESLCRKPPFKKTPFVLGYDPREDARFKGFDVFKPFPRLP